MDNAQSCDSSSNQQACDAVEIYVNKQTNGMLLCL
jgi:hypothetical protein